MGIWRHIGQNRDDGRILLDSQTPSSKLAEVQQAELEEKLRSWEVLPPSVVALEVLAAELLLWELLALEVLH